MRSLIFLPFALGLLSSLTSSAVAEMVFETEPNNTILAANRTLGFDDLGFSGSLTKGDVDTLSLFITPNEQNQVFFEFNVDWSEGTDINAPAPPQNHWLVARFPVDDYFAQVGLEYNQSIMFFGVYPSPPQVYYLQIYSSTTPPDPFTFDPVPGSTVEGQYRLTNIRGFNGAFVQGTAVPEPSCVPIALALVGSGLCLRRRMKKGQ